MNNVNSLNSTSRNNFINNICFKYYNSLDLTKKRNNIIPSRNYSKHFFDNTPFKINIINNNINININNDIQPKYKNLKQNNIFINKKKRINHRQNLSSIYTTKKSLKINTKLKKNLSKHDLMKSESKLTIKKIKQNLANNRDPHLIRSKTQKKIRKPNANNENIMLNSTSILKNNKKKINNNDNSNIKKNKFKTFYKKIDYSYVKPKVETGLSEIMLKKLLNNNKKISRNQTNKNNETENKQSILKRCKITMNKTIDNFKTMASNIKKKLFKGENKETNNIIDEYTIHSCRNAKKKVKNNE